MDKITVPDGAVGRVGLVATLKGLGTAVDGKMVVVREPAGFVTELVGSHRPVFAWLVQSMGEPVDCHGKPSRAFYVPDCCLVPLAEMSDAAIARLVGEQSESDFSAALLEAKAALGVHDLSDEELDQLLEKAARQAFIGKALELVAVPTALREIGFLQKNQDDESLTWVGIHDGVELIVSAIPGWLSNWHLMSSAKLRNSLVCDERVVPNELPRGKVFLTILEIWRLAFGNAVVPDRLQLGLMYEQHVAEMRILNPGLPTLWVDPKVFRMTLRWLNERQPGLWDDEDSVELSFADGLLCLKLNGISYGCPAQGHWTEVCRVRLSHLVSLAPGIARVRSIRLERAADFMTVNGCEIAIEEEGNGK